MSGGGAGFWGAGVILSPPNPYIWMAEMFWLTLDFVCIGRRYDDSWDNNDDLLAGEL